MQKKDKLTIIWYVVCGMNGPKEKSNYILWFSLMFGVWTDLHKRISLTV